MSYKKDAIDARKFSKDPAEVKKAFEVMGAKPVDKDAERARLLNLVKGEI